MMCDAATALLYSASIRFNIDTEVPDTGAKTMEVQLWFNYGGQKSAEPNIKLSG
jgi:hypothetical protein